MWFFEKMLWPWKVGGSYYRVWVMESQRYRRNHIERMVSESCGDIQAALQCMEEHNTKQNFVYVLAWLPYDDKPRFVLGKVGDRYYGTDCREAVREFVRNK